MTVLSHDCKEELHNADLRVTPARLGVLEFLEHSKAPVDVSMVAAYLQKHRIPADEATVFRILHSFTQKGITKSIQFHESKLRYEYAGKPSHHHFVCEKCGTIQDVTGCTVDILEKDIERKTGATVKRHSLEFFGLCGRCVA